MIAICMHFHIRLIEHTQYLILLGKVSVDLENGNSVKLKDGDFINYLNFNENNFIKGHHVLSGMLTFTIYYEYVKMIGRSNNHAL